jgi:hypothetical protein
MKRYYCLIQLFFGLLDGVESGLTTKNRDTFTRNIDTAKRSLQNQPLGINFGLIDYA